MTLSEIIEKYPKSCANCLHFRVFLHNGRAMARCKKNINDRKWVLRKKYSKIPELWIKHCKEFTRAEEV